MEKRDTEKYVLKEGNKILYVGITNNFDRRFKEHLKEKSFAKMEKVGRKTTRNGAKVWETVRLETYAQNHGGKVPDLNKTKNGK